MFPGVSYHIRVKCFHNNKGPLDALHQYPYVLKKELHRGGMHLSKVRKRVYNRRVSCLYKYRTEGAEFGEKGQTAKEHHGL